MTATSGEPTAAAQPRSIRWAVWALLVQAGFSISIGLSLYADKAWLRGEFVKSNAKETKDKKSPYDLATPDGLRAVNADVQSFLTSSLIQALLIAVFTALLIFPVRKGRTWAKWGATIIIAYLGLTRASVIAADVPALFRICNLATALAGFTAIFFLFRPESGRFFAAMRGSTPARPAGRGLFARPDRTARPAAASTQTPTRVSARTGAKGGSRPVTKPAVTKPAVTKPAPKTAPSKVDVTKVDVTKVDVRKTASAAPARVRRASSKSRKTPQP